MEHMFYDEFIYIYLYSIIVYIKYNYIYINVYKRMQIIANILLHRERERARHIYYIHTKDDKGACPLQFYPQWIHCFKHCR